MASQAEPRASTIRRHGKVQRPGRKEVDDEVKAGLVEFPEQSPSLIYTTPALNFSRILPQ